MLPKLEPLTAIIRRYVTVHEFILGSQEMEVMPYLIREALDAIFVIKFQNKHVVAWYLEHQFYTFP